MPFTKNGNRTATPLCRCSTGATHDTVYLLLPYLNRSFYMKKHYIAVAYVPSFQLSACLFWHFFCLGVWHICYHVCACVAICIAQRPFQHILFFLSPPGSLLYFKNQRIASFFSSMAFIMICVIIILQKVFCFRCNVNDTSYIYRCLPCQFHLFISSDVVRR